ncbi:MAG: tRNA pseudouridine(55) synthase TruB [Actinomycetota bacterium]|nr:tRNA pseudouridine(55) synthase TruB [Actinomycetota bacterium]
MDGFLLVDKAGGMTSHDVVAKVRKKLDTKKVGHAGTLDPMATGVLVLGVGIATRLLPYITGGKKSYQATILLGKATHTDDKEGDITFTADKSVLANISDKEINDELLKFVGKIKQRPSSVSAIKIDGKTAHARVRAGESVEIAERDVVIDEINIISIQRPSEQIQVEISVTCSAGTYIRAIARDLGERLKVGGHLIKLRRNLVSPFVLEQCKSIEEAALIPIGEVIEKIFPIRKLDLSQSREISFGRVIEQNPQPGVFAAIDNQDNFVALLENKLEASHMVAAPILVKGSGQ